MYYKVTKDVIKTFQYNIEKYSSTGNDEYIFGCVSVRPMSNLTKKDIELRELGLCIIIEDLIRGTREDLYNMRDVVEKLNVNNSGGIILNESARRLINEIISALTNSTDVMTDYANIRLAKNIDSFYSVMNKKLKILEEHNGVFLVAIIYNKENLRRTKLIVRNYQQSLEYLMQKGYFD